MRSVLMCTAIAILGALPATAQTEATDELPKPIEQCIRDNAPAVEKAVPSLTEAVNFLVSDVCAAPIAKEEARRTNERMAALREQARKECAQYKQPQPMLTPQGEENPCANSNVGAIDLMSGWTLYAPSANRPAFSTAFAAKILLDLRIAHMNATSTQGTH
jgi:hypothetical protein